MPWPCGTGEREKDALFRGLELKPSTSKVAVPPSPILCVMYCLCPRTGLVSRILQSPMSQNRSAATSVPGHLVWCAQWLDTPFGSRQLG